MHFLSRVEYVKMMIIIYMDIRACERFDEVQDGKAWHARYLPDVYQGEHDVLVRAKMALGGTSADQNAQAMAMQLTI